jgi:hypothetical protein
VSDFSPQIIQVKQSKMLAMIKQSVKAVVKHYKKGDLNWPMIIYIGLAHVAGKKNSNFS